MKTKWLISLPVLAGTILWGAGQPSGLAQSVVSPPANLIQVVAPPQGYPESQVYPGVPLAAVKSAAPASSARQFLLDAAEIIAD